MTIQDLRERNLIIFEGIVGSQAYGTAMPTSDKDIKGVFIQPLDDLLGFGLIEQVNDDKNDIVFYEIKRFLELIKTNNPNIIELLNLPEECVIYKHEVFDIILENKDKFLSKKCKDSFLNYSYSQIKKAKGQDKKQNWEKDKVTRKNLLDFVYSLEEGRSIPWNTWKNIDFKYDEKFCGVVNIPNARDVYALYYDFDAHYSFSDLVSEKTKQENKTKKIESGLPMGLGFKGLVKVSDEVDSPESNSLRLSSVPLGQSPICTIIYNKDSYTQHCKEYKSYQTWLENRNLQRWIDVETHNQKIDGKNLMHCKRLMDMAKEIALGKGIIVKRPNADELLKIRRGEVDLQTLIDSVEEDMKEISELFEKSTLPNSIDIYFIDTLLINIRKKFYRC